MATKFTATRTAAEARTDLDAEMAYWNSGVKATREEAVRAMVVYLVNAVDGWKKLNMDAEGSREALALKYFFDAENGLRVDAEEVVVDGIQFRINAW